MITIAAIHTAIPMIQTTQSLIQEHIPQARLFHIADSSLIQDVIQAGSVTPAVQERLTRYCQAAIEAGANIIFNTCSSVGQAAEIARTEISVPIVKIDDAMARQAVQQGQTIAVLATLSTTLAPTLRLLHQQAQILNKTIHTIEGLASGAFEAIIHGDTDTHDRLLLQTALAAAREADLIVLAQGSMTRVQQTIAQQTNKPVLSSPLPGVLDLKAQIDTLINH